MKNTDKSPQIHFPKVPPEKAVADYKRSQKFHSIPTLYPEFDVVHHNDPKSNLALLQIKLRDTEDILAKKRHQQRETRADLNRQWETLDEKESQLRENFITFNTFVQENMEKRERAERKIIEELALIEQRDEDIKKHIARYVDFSQARRDMETKIKEYRLYESYLSKVVEYSAEFTSIQDMINRYLALIFAKKHLAQVQEDSLKDLENARNDMVKLTSEKHLEIVGLNNQISNLQSRYETANIKSLECEQLVVRIKNRAVYMMNEIDEVKSSIWNIYEHMSLSKGHPVMIPKRDVEAQMLYVKRTLAELCKINQILIKKQSKAPTKLKSESKTKT